MRRKIACFLTAAVTILFMVFRVFSTTHPQYRVAGFPLADALIAVALVSFIAVAALCFSKKHELVPLEKTSSSLSGWVATFSGAMLIMSVVLDVFCWSVYDQTPAPGAVIMNNVDLYCLILSLIFGLCSGIFLITQGFRWMVGTKQHPMWIAWLSVAPVLWMWFRLARYEISYASTIDISQSFFGFATLVTVLLFFAQMMRVTSNIGTQPKNGLIIFSLFTTMMTLSGAPLIVYQLSHGASIESVLIDLVDAVIGLLAFIVAVNQAFATPQTEHVANEDHLLAWTTPAKERAPLDPPFCIDEKLPSVDEVLHDVSATEEAPKDSSLTVDDILAELNKNDIP